MRSGERFAAECGRTWPKDPIRRLNAAADERYVKSSALPRELKGKVLLKKKVYRHRQLNAEVDAADIPALACAALNDGAQADARMLPG